MEKKESGWGLQEKSGGKKIAMRTNSIDNKIA